MLDRQNVYLVGPMGVGKTTIGRQLANILDKQFIDTDHEIENKAGADIPWIFDVEGEAGFRLRESRVLEEVASAPGKIVSTGGGIVLNPDNRELLKKTGVVVFLTAGIDHLVSRTARDRKRPLLKNGNVRDVLQNVMALRKPLYEEIADIVINTEKKLPKAVVKEIIKNIKKSHLNVEQI